MIRQKAAQRWQQWDSDPELSAPLHLLFKQVQSPRHVISELLQNADDAEAKEATVRVDDEGFLFEHDGGDFTEEHFASLCRFGYSNKRALHTIGFRGVGFKSTFSLGDRVELLTPTLAVAFHSRRFTEPEWIDSPDPGDRRTRIRVAISDDNRRGEIERNLDDWLQSPLSLLFFRHLRRIRIEEREVCWINRGPGPIPGSQWMALNGEEEETHLVVRSDPEPFPADALAEIRQERMLGAEEETEFPASQVEIVLGTPGRLYVVLQTGVDTQLPFACNGPFIQDPARIKIKDPETSPTNRWLLERAGRLAASAMLKWLHARDRPVVERSRAYDLFPDVDRADNSLEGVCGSLVERAFESGIEGQDLLLTDSGDVVASRCAIAIAPPILSVWPPEQAAAMLDPGGRPALSSSIASANRKKLVSWGCVEEVDKQRLLPILLERHLPRPEGWYRLLNLWAYVAPELTDYSYYRRETEFKIVPVQGEGVLHAASDVVRFGDKRLLQNDKDWEFLATHLLVLNPNWPRFIADQKRAVSDQNERAARQRIDAAHRVLERIGLANASNAEAVVAKVAAEFFSRDELAVADCVRFAQIAAKLDVGAASALRFVTRDGQLRAADEPILFDRDGRLEDLLPLHRRVQWVLHAEYDLFTSCSRSDWELWIRSGRAGVITFPPIVPQQSEYRSRDDCMRALREIGYRGDASFPYSTGRIYPYQRYFLTDYDFDAGLIDYWSTELAEEGVWGTIVSLLAEANPAVWRKGAFLEGEQTSTNGQSMRTIHMDKTPAAWARRLADVRCLPDTHGILRQPFELLRRTPQTEAVLDVEPFIDARLDVEHARPLLDLLGVRTSPAGPDTLLDRIRVLAAAPDPPAHEVDRWYRRLDQLVTACAAADFGQVKQAFETERLILTETGSWATVGTVYLQPDEDAVPEADIIRRSVRDLTLWGKVGVQERPTAQLAVAWLMALPAGAALSAEDVRRVRALQVKHPRRIWEECGHWLSLAGEWTPLHELEYELTMQSLTPWGHLHPWVKKKTADLQRLPAEITANQPFASLPSLSSRIEERIPDDLLTIGPPVPKAWLQAFAAGLRRVELDDEAATRRIRSLAERLVATDWFDVLEIQVIPYIDGVPAGTPRSADVAWLGTSLYVCPMPRARLARRVPEEIGKAFDRADVKAALDYSFDRSAEDVREYLDENFVLTKFVEGDGAQPISDRQGGQRPPHGDQPVADRTEPIDAETSSSFDDNTDLEPRSLPGEDEAAAHSPDAEEAIVPPRPQPAPKRPQPDVMERYALTLGFQKDGADRFFHSNGDWIARVRGNAFPWERRTRNGNLVRCYWSRAHCLDHEPLQLDAEIWGLLEHQPDLHALVLVDGRSEPVEITGSQLRAMRDGGEVTLYPASYRLVCRTE